MKQYAILLVTIMLVLPACQTPMPWQKSSSPPPAVEPSPLDAPGTPAPAASQPAGQPVQTPAPGLTLDSEQRFKDLPLPTGLSYDAKRSVVIESAATQVARLVYTTRATMDELIMFFQRECPAAGWKLDNTLSGEQTILNFSKQGRRLDISIENKPPRGRKLSIVYRPDGGSVSNGL